MIKYLNLVFFSGMIVMNYLANALPLNNRNTGEISDTYPNLFVPAGITFAIWAVIYLLLAVYCVLQFTSAGRGISAGTGLAFGISCILNAFWIVFWHYGKMSLSLAVMAGILVSLIYINMGIRDHSSLMIRAAFGFYLGWICIATIANVTAALVSISWSGWGISEESWAIIMIFTGTLISAISLLNLKNPFVAISVIWAFTGIILKRQSDHWPIVIASITGIIILSAAAVYGFLKKI